MKKLSFLSIKQEKWVTSFFQLPPWAAYSERMIRYMRRVAEVASDFRIAVEIRNSSWLADGNREQFLDLLREFNIAYVVVDEPELDWTVRPELYITATWGSVVRFHGEEQRSMVPKRGCSSGKI